MDRLALGPSWSVSLAELLMELGSFAPLGGATVAIFVSVPVALLEIVAVSVNVAVPPTAKLTVAEMLPFPLGVPQLDPDEAVQVHEAFVNAAGKLSVTVAPVMALGPALLTTMV